MSTFRRVGGAENAGHENAGLEIDGPIYRNLQGMKLQDMMPACYTRIGSRPTCGIEIYWRSFQHFGTTIIPSETLRPKNDTNGPKLVKNVRKLRCFCQHLSTVWCEKIELVTNVQGLAYTYMRQLHGLQESCAIAKMTAQCAIYMGALKIFGTP